MKLLKFIVCLCILNSCRYKSASVHQSEHEHLVGFEIDGRPIEFWQFQESEKVPEKVYSYYEENGNRVKDGQEILFLHKNEIRLNTYSHGKLVAWSVLPSSNN